ncbi:hypothetical protein EC973_000269 [Apophysomyces ossiformis]|uniref:LIM zinc-binding domain-containing protein n=1 Tax=Apophysomyces ossiformis TaxID=679940 RepID=A0A8H7BYC5_9FUNG|nr:hypothetical protein EC973_000269 [Apophysomyces ossiformis]
MPKVATCDEPVEENDAMEARGQIWHKSCFRCHICFEVLGKISIDSASGKPCCKACQRPTIITGPLPSSSVSTPIQTPSLTTSPTSTMSSNYFNSIKSNTQESLALHGSRNAASSQLPTASQLFYHYQKSLDKTPDEISPEPKGPTSSTPLPLSHKEDVPRQRVRTTSFSSSETSQELAKRIRRICSHCQKPLKGSRRLKLPLPTGDRFYHMDCLTCAGCHGHFTELGFATDGTNIYHTQVGQA